MEGHVHAMSSTRWRKALENALSKTDNTSPSKYQHGMDFSADCTNPRPAYTLATVDVTGKPRARTVVHRGFVNPIHASDALLLITTDIRSQKVQNFLTRPFTEVSWWISETNEQFRIEARAFVVPALDQPLYPKFSDDFKRLASFSWWEEERKKCFNSMSGFMRASWARPPPGSPIPNYEEGTKWPYTLPKIGGGEDDTQNEQITFALSNFALVVLQPTRVDYVELGPQPNQRTIFTISEDESTWQEEIVVP
jgi:hypothetical protein